MEVFAKLSLSISLITDISEESDDDTDDSDDADDDVSDLEGAAPTPKHQRLAREEALERSLASGLYPQFIVRDRHSHLIQVKTMSLHSCSWFGQHLYVN